MNNKQTMLGSLTEDKKTTREIEMLVRSTPENVQKIILRFLRLSMSDSAFCEHYKNTAAKTPMSPAELDVFMDRWTGECTGKEGTAG